MNKVHVNLSLNGKTIDECRKRFINMSEIAQRALDKVLGKIQVEITAKNRCEFCGRDGDKETASEIQPVTNTKEELKFPHNLTWLYPDEKWICNICLRSKAVRTPVSGK